MKTETSPTSLTPFFVAKVANAPLVVRSGVRAGLAEQMSKAPAAEEGNKRQ